MAGRLRWALRDGWIIAVRDMQQWVREPQMIVWGLLFPIMFVLLFAYVFGSGMIVPGGGNYREFLMAGMFAQTMAFGIGETAMAVQVDSAKGVMDRFRSMPMAPSAVVVGRCIAAMVYSAVSLAILVATGVAIGWRWHGSLGEAVAAFGLLLLLRLAFLWLGILLGLRARNAESVNSLYGLLYPVTMLSSAFIAVELMPAWLGAIATWNPLSATINATRELFGNPGVETAGWVADNSLLMAIVWPVVITAVTLPFAVRAYQGLFAVRRSHDHIEVRGARENNLREVDVDIPKGQLTVFTGVSGSGKSSLVFDTIAAESRRLFNETYTAFLQSLMPSPGRPDVDSLRNLSAAIVVDQERMGANSRSTVGTATDTYSMLRIVFSRIAEPHVGHANAFSFNDPAGMCEACEGLGRVDAIDVDAMVDREKSLDDGAITLPNFGVGTWYWQIFAGSGFFDTAKPLRDYTADEWDRFLYGAAVKVANSAGFNSTYEGLVPKFRRLFLAKDLDSVQAAHREAVERIATFADCPACGGARLNAAALSARIAGRNIAECAAMEVSDLAAFVASVDAPAVAPLLGLLADTLGHLVTIGLGYLSLDRESGSLSGGEAQRVKMVRHLGSSLTDITYVFDEPTVGLHPHDIARMNELLLQLRDKGNTVLVVEHEPAVIAVADHVVDLGPGAGPAGGTVVYQGDVAGLRRAGTRTGDHLERRQPLRTAPRRPTGHLRIEHAGLHNLRDVSVDVPLGVLTVVSGVAGSGKSSLVRGSLAGRAGVTMIDQAAIRGSRRSNPATYTGVLDPIRKAFASANKVKASLFSANSEGACPACKGIGVIYTDLVFMAGVTTPCEACEGKRFTADVLEYRLRGRDISEVRLMPVVEAQGFFTERAVRPMLDALVEVGLGYVVLGQPLTTLSGGERQRLKLAMNSGTSDDVIVLDEPTSGLHMADTDHLLGLLDRLVEAGRSVIVIEHDLDVVARADWVIDMGPGAGHHGGTVVFEGPPTALLECAASLTGQHLRRLCTCG